jgi:hypothetical protein
MADTVINLIKQFNIRTSTPLQITLNNLTDNNNQFVTCFSRAISRIQTDGKWAPTIVFYDITGDGVSDTFLLPDDFVNLATPQLFNFAVKIPLTAATPEEFIRIKMLGLQGEPLLQYMIIDRNLQFSRPPMIGAKIAMAYYSNGLVNNWDAGTSTFKTGATLKDVNDTFKIDDELLILGAQMFYAQQLGMQGADVAEAEYSKRLAWVKTKLNPTFIKDLDGSINNKLQELIKTWGVMTQPYFG